MKALLSLLSAFAIAATLLLPTTIAARADHRGFGNIYTSVEYRRGGRYYGHRRYHGPRRHYHARRHFRHHRHRYRHHHGPSFGIIIGGGLPYYRPVPRYVAPPPVIYPVRPAYGLSRAHVDWCYSRYRSYRVSDNTFQPYHGPRRACISPY